MSMQSVDFFRSLFMGIEFFLAFYLLACSSSFISGRGEGGLQEARSSQLHTQGRVHT